MNYYEEIKKEIPNIKEKFDEVIMHSQNIDNVCSDILFDKWIKGKEWFIKTTGKLIYEIPKVSFELSDEEKTKRFESFILEDVSEFNQDLSTFLNANKDGFFENKVLKPYKDTCYDRKSGKMVEKNIPKGMKISRAMKFFESDPVLLDKLQTKMSMILQENKVSGTLCFSVHPLDYLSSSENTFNWRSCHSLDGQYRAGNLSYMLDDSTVICYLKDVILPHFPETVPWNNKKWRMLLFFSKGKTAHFAGRQYPFFSSQALDLIRELFLQPIIYKNYCTKWTNWSLENTEQFDNWIENLLFNKYISIRGKIYLLDNLIKDASNSRHFNDLTRSSCYKPYYGWRESYIRNDEKFIIGSEVPCLYCGKKSINVDSTMLCNEHELDFGECKSDDFDRCDICGELCHVDDLTWDAYGREICPSCLEEHYIHCRSCGEYYLEEHSVYDSKTEHYLCKNCFEQKYEEE